MTIVLFEDDRVQQLNPVAVGKPAFAIHCGGSRLIDLLTSLADPLEVSVRPHLRQIVAADFSQARLCDDKLPVAAYPATAATLLVNARLVPSQSNRVQLKQLTDSGRSGVVYAGDSLAAVLLTPDVAAGEPATLRSLLAELSLGRPPASSGLPSATARELPRLPTELALFEFPHDVVRHHVATLHETLAERILRGDLAEVADGVFTAPGATIGQFCVTDTRRGPIVLEAGASVGPYCLLSGPLHLGAGARVLEHAALKDGVAIGHTAKIGGEVEASIIEPYTNKQHHGFLGHSYLGSWINLGAGTCNSDLKNTYGQVNMEYHGRKVATGMQFVGAIVGDYAKTAINTGIFTGKTIGVCSMVYGFVTTNVPSFVNYARLFGQVTEAPVEVMAATQRRMFARRGVEQRPCDVQLLHDMYALTAAERAAGGEPLSLEPLSL